ncbi:hypothetical protein KEM56_000315 [Ascosphaera pollenicola]|nr:hypothetical protein KEM56_000315 [Ascosphaera pollenicola]
MSPRISASTANSARKAQEGASGLAINYKETPFPTTSARLRSSVVEIFADAQRSTTGHRKLVIRLRKIQEVCSGVRAANKADQHGDDFDENASVGGAQAEKEFNAEISRCLLRVLPVKRTEGAGDKVIKFLAAFLMHASEKDSASSSTDDPDEAEIMPETPTSRLTFALASTYIPLTVAKDRTVRYRATQILTYIVGSLTSIDDEVYYALRQSLTRRIRDKEPAVRNQAVTGLSRLVGDDDDGGDGKGLLDRLLDILQNDSNAEVRRTLLLNLPLSKKTLPFLLERARDTDTATRKALYSRLLPTLGDFRHLSLSMREKLLRWGIQDRDEAVRKATGRLFYEHWIEDCASSQQQNGETEESHVSISALVEMLERIDVLSSGTENGVAHEAMRSFWEGRPDYRQALTLDDEFWESLTPESIFMVRSFNDFCRCDNAGKYDDLIEEKLPEVTALAIYLHKYTTELITRKRSKAPENTMMELEFVVEQFLYICLTLDYSDEVGRRKMFTLLREILATSELSESITRLVVEVLRTVCGSGSKNEAEFCSVVLEAIAEVHDTIAADSFDSAASQRQKSQGPDNDGDVDMMDIDENEEPEEDNKPFNKEEAKEKLIREIVVNMKCLYIAQCMLQNIEGDLQNNDNLVTMLNNLVIPAVRSHEAPIRERGIECLGLCCLLDKNLAEENILLFVHCFSRGHEALQETAIKILADILTVHTSIFVPVMPIGKSKEPELRPYHRPVLKVFAKALRPGCPESVQAAAVISLSKLLLTGTLSPSGKTITETIREMNEKAVDQLLQALILAYFNPGTKDNLVLRQALTYFLPVYCHSRLGNAKHMCRITVSMVRIILAAAEEYYSLEAEEDSEGELIDEESGEKEVRALMGNVIGMLVEWTDERRVVEAESISVLETSDTRRHAWLHLSIAKDLLERALGAGEWSSAAGKGERKYLLSMLSKLHIPSPADLGSANQEDPEGRQLATETKELLDHAIIMGIATDATGRNALVKAKNTVLKILSGPQAESRSAGRRKDRRGDDDDDETVVGDTTVATAVTDATTIEHGTTTIEEEEGEGGEGESTVLAQGLERMRM